MCALHLQRQSIDLHHPNIVIQVLTGTRVEPMPGGGNISLLYRIIMEIIKLPAEELLEILHIRHHKTATPESREWRVE